MKNLKPRFMAKVDKKTNGRCWLWTSSIKSCDGTGIFHLEGRGRKIRAHRMAWLLFRGEIPDGMIVGQRCGVRICVNPKHLFLHAPNEVEEPVRGVNKTGVLGSVFVKTVRNSSAKEQRTLAKRFSVSAMTIRRIRNGGMAWTKL